MCQWSCKFHLSLSCFSTFKQTSSGIRPKFLLDILTSQFPQCVMRSEVQEQWRLQMSTFGPIKMVKPAVTNMICVLPSEFCLLLKAHKECRLSGGNTWKATPFVCHIQENESFHFVSFHFLECDKQMVLPSKLCFLFTDSLYGHFTKFNPEGFRKCSMRFARSDC